MEHLVCNVNENEKLLRNAYTSNGIMSFLPIGIEYSL
jgi:hypothetical protein